MKRTTLLVTLCGVIATFGCAPPDEPAFSYYEERIAPSLTNGCSRGPSGGGCHLPNPDGTALGNLDVSSYDALMRRRDLLTPYGPYASSLLLLKAGEAIDVQVETFAADAEQRFVSIQTDIRHNNGQTIDLGSRAYAQLRQWIGAGHTRSGVPDESTASNQGECVPHASQGEHVDHPLFAADFADRYPDAFQRFRDEVEPVLRDSCAGSACHGSPVADLVLTCPDGAEGSRWNFWVAVQHLTTPASTSGLLRRPLSSYRGGVFHEGGNIFSSADDPGYRAILSWAEELVSTQPDAIAPPSEIDEGLRFFANRVQPVLVRKGCMFMNCHSVAMFHDLRLQGGSQGHFSRVGTYRNWESSRSLLALESTNPNESRLVAKNLYPPELLSGGEGIFHRGGSLFEDFGATAAGSPNPATPEDCAGIDADGGDLNEIPAYCVLARWHEIEREGAIARGEIDGDATGVRSVFYVQRPPGVGGARDFDTYRPGADLLRAPGALDPATGELTLEAGVSVLGACGLDPSAADIRGTAPTWDGNRVAFGARSSADAPLRLYWILEDGSGCEPIPGVAPAEERQDGILLHDFDPTFTADGRLVFASTRGYDDEGVVRHLGPTRTPAAMQPNANLYVQDADGSIRQLTYLLNQELQPSTMMDGRIVMTAEKREPGFHQLAGRRINLDGGDYHPLFAQRPSVGYASATEIVETLDRNLLVVGGALDHADGAGALFSINRSIGPDQDDRDPGDRFYISSQRQVSPRGAWRSPFALPSGRVLASCDRGAEDLTAGGFEFALCELNPDSGEVRELVSVPGQALVESVAVYPRAVREIFTSRRDEANGRTEVDAGAVDAEVNVLDFPLLASLLVENTREGRRLRSDLFGFDVIASYPPPAGTSSFTDVSGDTLADEFGMLYANREVLGHVDLNPDGSGRFRFPGGRPILLRPTGADGNPVAFDEGAPFSGDFVQREQMQFYPGERANQSFRRELFNGMCGGCHGSISGRELDVAVEVDALTAASWVQSAEQSPVDLGR